jgi:hypothetical protein
MAGASLNRGRLSRMLVSSKLSGTSIFSLHYTINGTNLVNDNEAERRKKELIRNIEIEGNNIEIF